jgi:hypothetical protein
MSLVMWKVMVSTGRLRKASRIAGRPTIGRSGAEGRYSTASSVNSAASSS